MNKVKVRGGREREERFSDIILFSKVDYKSPVSNWFLSGGEEVPDNEREAEDDGKTFFVQKYYDQTLARFEDIPTEYLRYCSSDHAHSSPLLPSSVTYCPSCERQSQSEIVRNLFL